MSAEVLGPGGALARAVDGYEDRPGQRAMAEAVADALEDGRALLVEAGTGTGKSLAYLVPALLSGRRVVVSTGTRTLQEQLLARDLPLVQKLLPAPVEVAVLKGVSNYVCRRKLALRGALVADTAPAYEALLDWSLASDTGDRAEHTSLAEDHPLWSEVTTTPEARLGARCPHYERCFVTRARRRAEAAALTVVNHHLFFADLALRGDGARVLPDYDAVIFDEAHQLEDILTDHFGIEISSARLELLSRDARDLFARDADLDARVLRRQSAGERMVGHLDATGARFAQAARLRLAPVAGDDRFVLPADLFTGEVRDAWLDLDTALDEIARQARLRAELRRDASAELADELGALTGRAERLRDALAAIAEGEGGSQYVFWGRLRGDAVTLVASPVAVDDVLDATLLPAVGGVVLTSATLTANGSFRHLRDRLGLGPDTADELRVESPFDYARQCLLYAARDLPDPRDTDARARIAERIAELVDITDGRAFALFTSHRALRDAAARLPELTGRPLLVQGQAPRSALLERFRSTPGSVLLATGAFWEGVDVPGDALSQVILDRLPFAVPTDPLIAARGRHIEERGGDAFHDYAIPQAVLAFRQGFGRLIRRRSDRGIVSVLDPRLVGKRYGRAFTDSVPEVARTSSIERVRRWWRDG